MVKVFIKSLIAIAGTAHFMKMAGQVQLLEGLLMILTFYGMFYSLATIFQVAVKESGSIITGIITGFIMAFLLVCLCLVVLNFLYKIPVIGQPIGFLTVLALIALPIIGDLTELLGQHSGV